MDILLKYLLIIRAPELIFGATDYTTNIGKIRTVFDRYFFVFVFSFNFWGNKKLIFVMIIIRSTNCVFNEKAMIKQNSNLQYFNHMYSLIAFCRKIRCCSKKCAKSLSWAKNFNFLPRTYLFNFSTQDRDWSNFVWATTNFLTKSNLYQLS